MPDEDHRYPNQRPVTVMISAEGIAARLAELPTRKEMYRAVLLGTTTGACLVQCLAWLFRG
jgi:type II secretory pathway component PulL